jgi:hypothetical protein
MNRIVGTYSLKSLAEKIAINLQKRVSQYEMKRFGTQYLVGKWKTDGSYFVICQTKGE